VNLNEFLASDEQESAKIKFALQGGSGMGKTYSALAVMTALVERTDPGKRVFLVDTENSARLYKRPRGPFDFDHTKQNTFGPPGQPNFDPRKLMQILDVVQKSGQYGAVVVDSATAFWKDPGGFTSMIDKICDAQRARGGKGDSFAAWKTVDPLYRNLMTYVRQYPLHLVFCVRAKQDYERTEGASGKGSLKKVGLAPEFRDGFEYEFDIQFAIDDSHTMVPLKHRLGEVLDERSFRKPGDDVAAIIAEWLSRGVSAPTEQPKAEEPKSKPEQSKPTVAKAEPKVDEDQVAIDKAAQAAADAAVAKCDAKDEGPKTTDDFLAAFKASQTEDELKKCRDLLKKEIENKNPAITEEDRTGKLSPAYSARMNELKAAKAA
jgi:hypothetical protein